jgi:peptide deformylase
MSINDNLKNDQEDFKFGNKSDDEEEKNSEEEEESGTQFNKNPPRLSIRDHGIDFGTSPKKSDVGKSRNHSNTLGDLIDEIEDRPALMTNSHLKKRTSRHFSHGENSQETKDSKKTRHVRSQHNSRREHHVASREEPQQTPPSIFSKVKQYMSMFLFALICVLFYRAATTTDFATITEKINLFWSKNSTEDAFVPLKLINYMPATKCYPVSAEEFNFFKTDKEWNHVVKSMLYYMINEELESISTFHVGHASCFMILRQEDGSFLSMFNPNFKGYHDTVYVRVNEVSVACPQITRVVERANTIIMTYNEVERGELVIEKFNNTQAWTAQATGFYLKGKTTCDAGKSNTDYGRVTLKEEIEDYLKH